MDVTFKSADDKLERYGYELFLLLNTHNIEIARQTWVDLSNILSRKESFSIHPSFTLEFKYLCDDIILAVYRNLFLTTSDIWNITQHYIHSESPTSIVFPCKLTGKGDLVFPNIPLTIQSSFQAEIHCASAPIVSSLLFATPRPTIAPFLHRNPVACQGSFDMARARWGNDVQPVFDSFGFLSAYRSATQTFTPWDIPDIQTRNMIFLDWRQYRPSSEYELEARGLIHRYHSTMLDAGQYMSAFELLFFTKQYSMIVIKGSCGVGKTVAMIQALKRASIVETESSTPKTNPSILIISTRRTFARDIHAVCEKYGLNMDNYLDCDEGAITSPRVICSLESLSRLTLQAYDIIVLDEFPEILQQLNSSTVADKVGTFKLFQNYVTQAKLRLLASDDIRGDHIAFMHAMCEDNVKKDRVLFWNVSRRVSEENKKYVAFVSSLEDMMRLLENDLGNKGYHVAFPCSSLSMCKMIKKRVESWRKKVLILGSETDDQTIRDACINANDILRSYDLVLFTSTAGSGVSLDILGHFDRVYQYALPTHRLELQKQALFRARHVSQQQYIIFVEQEYRSKEKPFSLERVQNITLDVQTKHITSLLFGPLPRPEAPTIHVPSLMQELWCEDTAKCALDFASFLRQK